MHPPSAAHPAGHVSVQMAAATSAEAAMNVGVGADDADTTVEADPAAIKARDDLGAALAAVLLFPHSGDYDS